MSLPPMMRAARLHRFGEPLAIETIPTPTPGPGQVIVRVLACGICHTDLHACRGDWRAKASLPLIPGHEIIGEIVAVGHDVAPSKVGDRVGVFWLNRTCGSCEYCEDGWESLCPQQVNTGFGVPGGFAEYAAVHADFAVPLASSLDPGRFAPFLCAGVTAYKAVRETELEPGDTLAIVGCGGVGHLAVGYAKAAGLRTLAIDVSDKAMSLARSMGADDVSSPADARQRKKVHGVLIAAASADAIRLGIDLLRRKGTAILVGLPPDDASIPVFDVVVKRFTLRGSIGGTRADVKAAIEIAAHHAIAPVVRECSIDDIDDALADLDAGRNEGRAVVRFDR